MTTQTGIAVAGARPVLHGGVKLLTCAVLSLALTGFSASLMNGSTVTPLTQAAALQTFQSSTAIVANR